LTPIIENFQPDNALPASETGGMNLQQSEAKINEYLKLFNERSNSQLKLFLTANFGC
jgi:hypothetical protein